jgi:hypothetical protein
MVSERITLPGPKLLGRERRVTRLEKERFALALVPFGKSQFHDRICTRMGDPLPSLIAG